MKVLDLRCENGHCFEGWFADEQAFVEQQSGGLTQCPLCESRTVQKMLSAPRLNLGAPRPASSAASSSHGVSDPSDSQSGAPSPAATKTRADGADGIDHPAARWHSQARALLAQADQVGERFASEARAMHEGEIPHRAILGVASAEQVKELVSDGVGIAAVPAFLLEPLH